MEALRGFGRLCTSDLLRLLNSLDAAGWGEHARQGGLCTPDMLTTLTAFLNENADPSDVEICEAISGSLCCRTDQNLVVAALTTAKRMKKGP